MLDKEICRVIDAKKEDLIKLSHEIHRHPEVKFMEHTAVELIKAELEKEGFEFICPWASLDTSFKAVYHGVPGGKTVAFLAEYDALEKLGHGCGHNMIATMSVGAAIGLKHKIKDIKGDIVVMGCPGEEGGKGKVIMLNNDGFNGIDYAMMIHPSDRNMIQRGGLAAVVITIEFFGKSAHSKKPSDGINALTALLQLFNGIEARRSMWPDKARCNGIIIDGGTAPNVIPDYTKAKFTVRATTCAELEVIITDLENIAKGAELMVGAKAKVTSGLTSTERYCNLPIDLKIQEHAAELGINMQFPPKGLAVGSSDFGNVSMAIPGIHAYLSIAEAGEKINGHTAEFKDRAASPKADEILLIGAKTLAMTGYDLLTDEKLQAAVAADFSKVPKNNGGSVLWKK